MRRKLKGCFHAQLHRTIASIWFCVLLIGSNGVLASNHEAAFHIAQPADWVVVPSSPAVQEQAYSLAYKGAYYQLYDRQINAIDTGNQSFYRALEILLTNQTGVSKQSQIELDIDASYEHLVLHELGVIRDGQFIDKIPSSKIEALRSEKNMNSLIYDGTTTISAILSDVRVGDVLRYAYTINGANPVYAEEFETSQVAQYHFDINRIAFTLHTDANTRFHLRTSDIDGKFSPQQSVKEGVRTYQWSAEHVKALSYEDDEPSWTEFDPYFTLSTIENWHDIVSWMLPHYNKPETQNKELTQIAAAIEQRHNTTEAKIGAALQWVQSEIRYFGIELGANSHNPSPAEQTLSRRYGDCKDKTVLLIALLNKLGVKAQPALVNTTERLRKKSYAYRLHAFNHVIVHLEHEGQSHYLDPTLDTQKGDLGHFREPDYGKALIIAEGETALRDMSEQLDVHEVSIIKNLTIDSIDDSTAQLAVSTQRSLGSAEYHRWKLNDWGYRELSDNYVDYYREYYNRLSLAKPLSYKEYPQNNTITTEQYEVSDLWDRDEDDQWYFQVYADEILGYLELPETPNYRTRPYQLSHPINIRETNVIELADSAKNIQAEYAEETISNDYFTLTVEVEQDPSTKVITFKHHYETHSAVVPAQFMEQFEKDINRAHEITYFDIYKQGLVWENETDKRKPLSWRGLFQAILTGSL